MKAGDALPIVWCQEQSIALKMGNLKSAALEGGDLSHVALECEVLLISQAGSQPAAGRILVFRVEGLERQCWMSAA